MQGLAQLHSLPWRQQKQTVLHALSLHCLAGDWHQKKAIADRHLRVFVRNVDYDTMQLRDGVRLFVAEAYSDPSQAPPAYVDPVLQAAALNAKPPKPPRCEQHADAQACSACIASALAFIQFLHYVLWRVCIGLPLAGSLTHSVYAWMLLC